MDFLRWMFGSFWRFFGVVILAGVLFNGASEIMLALCGKSADCPSQTAISSSGWGGSDFIGANPDHVHPTDDGSQPT